MTPRERVVRILLRILTSPYRFSRKDLANEFAVSPDTIKDDLAALRNVGLSIDAQHDRQYRLAILPELQFNELRYLQPLQEEDKLRIARALDYLPGRDQLYLRNKLDSLYDFQQLGLRALRKPALDRIDQLLKAQKGKRQVVLKGYRSGNSNRVNDRIVEAFHLEPDKDLLQAYDVQKNDSRHYRLSRIERVELLDEPWKYESDHRTRLTDPFGIVNNQQVSIHLTLDVYAYNNLIESFPFSKAYLESGAEENTWDLQCQTNVEFKAVLPFILANAEHVIVHGPAILRQQIVLAAEKMSKKFS